ncbi:hypothetical protein CISG_06021 [Coccidioides immitis RMSCC 3703]|uniref:Uncharacterized protein n=2 Tax=Coccidioides immitis TaxID=5501 RepID=A0A0J8TTQ4_COCIT|nr:hypothetical protein CIRG_02481 [Coccidioides immitis RMSCC 2394]KMU77177.1 hypothetical protein CISG_06021 [Coccidioides immitis RMSCC 3703]
MCSDAGGLTIVVGNRDPSFSTHHPTSSQCASIIVYPLDNVPSFARRGLSTRPVSGISAGLIRPQYFPVNSHGLISPRWDGEHLLPIGPCRAVDQDPQLMVTPPFGVSHPQAGSEEVDKFGILTSGP